jgi:hypothetical protein
MTFAFGGEGPAKPIGPYGRPLPAEGEMDKVQGLGPWRVWAEPSLAFPYLPSIGYAGSLYPGVEGCPGGTRRSIRASSSGVMVTARAAM